MVLNLCMVTMCMCTDKLKILRIQKYCSYNIHSFIWPGPFLAQGLYRLQYKHPAKPHALSMVVYAM